jgi:hypothetical protein
MAYADVHEVEEPSVFMNRWRATAPRSVSGTGGGRDRSCRRLCTLPHCHVRSKYDQGVAQDRAPVGGKKGQCKLEKLLAVVADYESDEQLGWESPVPEPGPAPRDRVARDADRITAVQNTILSQTYGGHQMLRGEQLIKI